jgi:hypothetical protein
MSDHTRCAYPHGQTPPFASCGAPAMAGSPYCPEHYLLCNLPIGSRRERAAIRHIDRLAELAARRREPRPQAGVAPLEPLESPAATM